MGIAGLQMMLDRGERMEWFASPEIWVEADRLGARLLSLHRACADAGSSTSSTRPCSRTAISASSTIIFFVFGFVLLPTLALTSPMLEELLGYPADTAGYVTIPRGAALIGALILTWRAPTRIDNRLLVIVGMALVVYGNWRMLGYSPLMDWWPVVAAGAIQGAGLGMMMPALTREAFSTLDPTFRTGRHRAVQPVAALWQHHRRRDRPDLLLQQYPDACTWRSPSISALTAPSPMRPGTFPDRDWHWSTRW